MRFKLPIALMLLGMTCLSAQGTPIPWTISNLQPDGSGTLVVDTAGQLLEGPVLVQLLADREGDGIDPVIATGRNQPPDIGDDTILISVPFDLPIAGLAPRGSFVFFLTVDTDSLSQMNTSYFVRVWDGPTIEVDSRFATSLPFKPEAGRFDSQTAVQMPPHMKGYIGNRPPEVTVSEPLDEPMGGEVCAFRLTIADDESPVRIRVLNGELGGAVEIVRPTGFTANIHWTIPAELAGEIELPILVDDGQFLDTTFVPLDILPAGVRPSSFALISPHKEGAAFSGHPLRWQESSHPDGARVSYSFQWSTNPQFVSGQWINGLSGPEVTLEFEEPGAIRQSSDDLRRMGTVQQPVAGKRLLTERTYLSSGEQGLDEETTTVPLGEGTRFFWRVRAEAEDGSTRWCAQALTAFAEHADPPEAFSLISPLNEALLETTMPNFTWHSTTDPDLGDTLRYEFLWSVNGGENFDTIRVHSDTTLQLGQSEVVGAVLGLRSLQENSGLNQGKKAFPNETLVQRAPRSSSSPNSKAVPLRKEGLSGKQTFATAPKALDETPELDEELPQDISISWKVDAVDMAGVRRASDETRSLTVVIPDGPTGFDLIGPADGVVIRTGESVQLRWSGSIDPDPDEAVLYSVFVAEEPVSVPNPQFTEVAEGLQDTLFEFEVSTLSRQEWQWKVVAVSGEDSTWNNNGPAHFLIRPPYQPQLLLPEDGAEVSGEELVFRWQVPAGWAEDVSGFHLDVFDHPAMLDPILQGEAADTFFTIDLSELSEAEYWWRVTCAESDGIEWVSDPAARFAVTVLSVVDDNSALPTAFAIANAYPNPFNPSLTVVVAIPHAASSSLTLYDVLGREVFRESLAERTAGYHPVHIDLGGHAAGTYIVRLLVPGSVDQAQRVVLVK